MQVARSLSLAVVAAILAVSVGASAQESSLDGLRAAAKAAPNDPNAALSFGRALRRAGHDAEAILELRRGASLWNGRSGEVAVTLHYELARANIAKRDFSQAMVQCKVAGGIAGGASAGHACAAEAHLLWKRASEAHVATAAALAANPKNYDAKIAEARALELELKEAPAEAQLREAIVLKPDAVDAHVELGHLLLATGKTDAALATLKRAVELDPLSPEASYELSRALPAGPQAVAALEKALHERPTYAAAVYHLAEVQIDAGRVADARKSATIALRLDPQDANMHVIAGRVSLAEGKPDDAMTEAQTALGILANLASAKLLIADSWAKKGEIDLAVESYQAAWGLDHSDPTALVHASEACHAHGRDTSAKAFGDKATREFPTWGPGWVALGDALASIKETAAAKTAYETALKSKGPVDRASVEKKMLALK
jgi:tetratricopeptide (TPR) repeat protein